MATRRFSRRQILGIAVGASGLALSGRLAAFAEALKPTPGEILGPFYPVIKRVDQGADLTVIAGKPGRAAGEVIHVMGRVLNVEGQPVRGARVELWQANAQGRYAHASDKNPAPLDPNFEGFAVQTTDAEGRYRFKTIKPGAYPATGNWVRPPHLHFDVTGKVNRLVTQMYFPGDPLFPLDAIACSVPEPARHRIICRFDPETTEPYWALSYLFDFVLRGRDATPMEA